MQAWGRPPPWERPGGGQGVGARVPRRFAEETSCRSCRAQAWRAGCLLGASIRRGPGLQAACQAGATKGQTASGLSRRTLRPETSAPGSPEEETSSRPTWVQVGAVLARGRLGPGRDAVQARPLSGADSVSKNSDSRSKERRRSGLGDVLRPGKDPVASKASEPGTTA